MFFLNYPTCEVLNVRREQNYGTFRPIWAWVTYIMQKYHIYFVLLMFISLQFLLSYLVGILDIFRVVVFLQIDFVYSSL